MAKKGGQPGNNNAGKNKPWSEAIRKALLAEDGKKLRAIAEKIVALAMEGDMQAIKELGDRVEGKSIQAIEQKTEMTATVAVTSRPKLSKDEWLELHGVGTAARPTE